MELSLDSEQDYLDPFESFDMGMSTFTFNEYISLSIEEEPSMSEPDSFGIASDLNFGTEIQQPHPNNWWDDFRQMYNGNFEDEKLIARLKNVVAACLQKLSKQVLVECFRQKLTEMVERGGQTVFEKYNSLFHLLSCVRKVKKQLLVSYLVQLAFEEP